MDIDNIPYGIDFRDHLQEMLDSCDILLVVVGPRWFGRNEDGQPRLFDEEDWVRIEVATALEKKIPVIPLLVEGARMPKRAELPEDLQGFAFRQAAVLDVGVDFRVHMERLTKSMDRILASKKLPKPPAISENVISISKDQDPAPEEPPEPQPAQKVVSSDIVSESAARISAVETMQLPQAVSEDVISAEKKQSSISHSDLPLANDPPPKPTELASDRPDHSSLADEKPPSDQEGLTLELVRPSESVALQPVSLVSPRQREAEKINDPFASWSLLILMIGVSFFAVLLFLMYWASTVPTR